MLTNADVTPEAEQSLQVMNKEINSFLKTEEKISLEKGELNNTLYNDFLFPDVIDPDSCWRLYWQQVVTHEKIIKILRSLKTHIINTSAFTIQKNFTFRSIPME